VAGSITGSGALHNSRRGRRAHIRCFGRHPHRGIWMGVGVGPVHLPHCDRAGLPDLDVKSQRSCLSLTDISSGDPPVAGHRQIEVCGRPQRLSASLLQAPRLRFEYQVRSDTSGTWFHTDCVRSDMYRCHDLPFKEYLDQRASYRPCESRVVMPALRNACQTVVALTPRCCPFLAGTSRRRKADGLHRDAHERGCGAEVRRPVQRVS
jgi:hypothetical protein